MAGQKIWEATYMPDSLMGGGEAAAMAQLLDLLGRLGLDADEIAAVSALIMALRWERLQARQEL